MVKEMLFVKYHETVSKKEKKNLNRLTSKVGNKINVNSVL